MVSPFDPTAFDLGAFEDAAAPPAFDALAFDVLAFEESTVTSSSMSLNATEGADLASATVGLAVTMALAATEGADLSSAGVNLVQSMALAAVEGADTASGSVALVASINLAAVEGADICASNVALLITMAMAGTEGADLCGASMDLVASGVSMSLDVTEGADSCDSAMSLLAQQAESDQSKDGGGGSHWKHKPTAGAGLQVPYRHDKPVDEFGYEIYEVAATPLSEVVNAPNLPTIAAGPTELDLAIAPPYREPVAETQVLKTLQAQIDGIESAKALKAKQNNHALRLLLLAS
jgi:hypothetical protein